MLFFSPLVCSSFTDIIATLYGSVNIHMNHTLPEEYASVLQADGVDDNALLHMKNSTEGTSLNTRADGEFCGMFFFLFLICTVYDTHY